MLMYLFHYLLLCCCSSCIDTARRFTLFLHLSFQKGNPWLLLDIFSQPNRVDVARENHLEQCVEWDQEVRIWASVVKHTLRQRSDSPVSDLEELIELDSKKLVAKLLKGDEINVLRASLISSLYNLVSSRCVEHIDCENVQISLNLNLFSNCLTASSYRSESQPWKILIIC